MKSTKTLGQLLHDKRVSKINKAYASYRLEPTENGLNDLLKEVINLAKRKLRPEASKFGEVDMENEEDFAQKVAITVWEKLADFNREPDIFFPWVMKIIMNHKLHLYRDLGAASNTHIPFTLQDEEGEEYDNPEVYSSAGSGGSFRIPEGLDEEEELICYMILDKHSHSDIAEVLDVHVNTVGNRIKSLKERFAEVQNA